MKKQFLMLLVLLWCSMGLAVAQSRQVTGVVKSAEGETLPGVTVLVKGTTNGATTGMNGDFSLTLPEGGSPTLVFSYIGFTSKEVAVGSQSTINVTLATDSKQLDDVVVIGFQEVQRRDVTGSVSSVSAQQIKDVPVNSAAEALAGRLAGVQVTASEGQPGADVRIRVRGGGSITQDNSPLYVVDGVQVENALSVISPQDIASVDVLKDASATAIYGSRGANGVILITTKGGREGKTTVSYNGFAGVRRIANKLDLLKPADYVDYAYERSALGGAAALIPFRNRFGTRTFRDNTDYNGTAGYDTLGRARNAEFIDWQDKVFGRDAFQQTHNVAVSGGGKGTTYSLSLTRNTEDGIQIESGFTRNLVSFRFDHKASDRFRFGFNTRFNDQNIVGAGTSNQGSGSTTNSRLRNTLAYFPLNLNPNATVGPDENPDDDFFTNSGSLSNPVLTIKNEFRQEKRRLFNVSGSATFNIVKNLSIRSTVGFDNTNQRLETFNGQFSPTIRGANFSGLPFATIGTGNLVTLNNSNVLSYTLKNKGLHSFDAVLGHEIYEQRNVTQNVQSYYMPLLITAERALANINQRDPSAPTTPQPAPTTAIPTDSRLLSGFSRLNYSFADRYLFTATVRADASSKFARGNRLGIFPGASFAWRASSEKFLLPYAQTISDLKLRLSYGAAGNNRIADFLPYPLFTTGGNIQYALNETLAVGSAAVTLANPNLTWETTLSRNVGVDLGLFNNRVQFTADAYYNTTKDLLLNLAIPSTSGFGSQLTNIGATSNRGIELQLSGTVVQTPDFTWTASTNFSLNRGRVESLGPLNELPLQYSGWASTEITADYAVRVGQPVGLMYGYVTDFDNGRKGFYTADDFEGYNPTTNAWILKPGISTNRGVVGFAGANQQVTPGTIKLKDISGPNGVPDGIVNELDRTVIGNANPDFTGGFNQQFSYKGFDASLFLNFVVGNDVYNANKIDLTSYRVGSQLSNGLEIMNGRYRQIDENGALIRDLETSRRLNPNPAIWTPTRTVFPHSWAIEDGSFLRVNNLTLGYTLPKNLARIGHLQTARVYVTGNNLYTLTRYSGYDPEVNARRGNPLTPGVDYAAYPRSKVYLVGLTLTL